VECKLAKMNERRDGTIYQILRSWAEDTPDAIAIASPGHESITYLQLFDKVDYIINSLNKFGIGSNDRVAIVLPNGIEMIAVFLGVSCIAISAPLNPLYRENEFDFYLSDLSVKALVVRSGVDSAAASAAQRRGIPVIEVVSASNTAVACGFTLNGPAPSSFGRYHLAAPDDVALVLHTSGTTSNPKRVPLTHRNLCASALSQRDTLNLTSNDRCLNIMPLFHIHGLVGGLLSSLTAGGSFVVTPNFEGNCFIDWMMDMKPTWYTAVPAMHQAILRSAGDRAGTIKENRLRFIRSSSAPLPPTIMAELEALFKVPVIEAYGMTEAAHQITSNPLPPLERKSGSVGMATHTEVAVVDGTGNFLEAGENGEIVVRGVSVTLGYEDNNEANQKSLSNGWFRTGDLGQIDSDGYLFLTGRLKELINRGGEKISPREIEEVLLEHPDVLQAVAFAIPHPSLGEDIAAVVELRNQAWTAEANIRGYLVSRLAAFKLPSRLLILDEIPMTSTGKVRRTELAETFTERLKSDFVAPKNKLEAVVAGIYADVLGTQPVSAADNFFALGGDSLRAIQVISRVRSLFGIDLPIATLFLRTTVAELAEEIAAWEKVLGQNSQAPIFTELTELSRNHSHPYDTDALDRHDSESMMHEMELLPRK
jgi:acyl-CoA synthetase (AMP-forming)/AMP-acid ligase II/acyl carrier protein